MSRLVWDSPGTRTYQSGLDRGVIYLQSGNSIAWNGLVSVTEETNESVNPIYFDGQKVLDLSTPGSFSGTISAMTYPDQLIELEGFSRLNSSVYIGEQRPQTFNLSYRTLIGNDLDQDPTGYRIHILYNVTAIPSTKSHSTLTADANIETFEWAITTVPEEVPGFRPSSHVVIDTASLDPNLLSELELMLYGGETANPSLLSFVDLMTLVLSWYRLEIVDNNDGTWTANSFFDGYIYFLPNEEFRIDNVDAVYLDANTYEISNTFF